MIILVGQTKGGVGKSLIAAHVAVRLAQDGRDVILIDADRQATSSKWASSRTLEGASPPILCARARAEDRNAADFREKVTALAERFDDIVIDSGGHDSRELRASVLIADALVAPVGPSLPDLWGLADFDEIVGQFLPANPDLETHVVINRAHPLNIHDEIAQARDAIASLAHLRFSGVTIFDRQTFRSAYQDGLTALDLDQSKPAVAKAAADIEALHQAIRGRHARKAA